MSSVERRESYQPSDEVVHLPQTSAPLNRAQVDNTGAIRPHQDQCPVMQGIEPSEYEESFLVNIHQGAFYCLESLMPLSPPALYTLHLRV
jgi:hypothetical protein